MTNNTATEETLAFAHLRRDEPALNMHRFYRIHVTPGIFDDWLLVREWGRTGSPGTVRKDAYPTREATSAAGQVIIRKKLKKGYQLLASD